MTPSIDISFRNCLVNSTKNLAIKYSSLVTSVAGMIAVKPFVDTFLGAQTTEDTRMKAAFLVGGLPAAIATETALVVSGVKNNPSIERIVNKVKNWFNS